MATCKDCIHCRACHEMYLLAVSQEDDFFEIHDADTCEDFKHKYSLVQVVICKDCKWWIGERCLNPNGAYNYVTGPYWFCKSGQRRGELK